MDLESTPIHQYTAPTSACLEPPKSSKPILTPGYELHPCLINMVEEQFFSGEDDENTSTYVCLSKHMHAYTLWAC